MSKAVIFLLQLYHWFTFAKYQFLVSVFGYAYLCKHSPSCSEYTILQIREHGTIGGLLRGLKRLSQCR